jgi:hypothetical protein
VITFYIGQQLANRRNGRPASISDIKDFRDGWFGGTITKYLVDGRWITRFELTENWHIETDPEG